MYFVKVTLQWLSKFLVYDKGRIRNRCKLIPSFYENTITKNETRKLVQSCVLRRDSKVSICQDREINRNLYTGRILIKVLTPLPFLLPANEVWDKVNFTQACVSHSVHKGVPSLAGRCCCL